MKYYFKTRTKTDFIQDLERAGIHVNMETNYYQDSNIVVDWIGLIPEKMEYDENGNPIGQITYKAGQFVNVQSTSAIDLGAFMHTTEVFPDPPYRTFS